MSDKCNCNPYPGVPVPPCPPCPPKPGRPCPPPPPPFKPLPGGTQQYIGARYVPVFAEPIEWDINKPYESLTIVTYQGNSYTSKCAVPGGTEITNTRYWAKTGDYNAQVAEYRAAVGDLSTQVTGFAKDNAEFREKIDKYDKDNAAMKNDVAAATARVDDLAKRVDTAEADIDGLQATTNQHTQKLADLEAADTRLAQSIAENDTDIAALQTKDVQHDSEISAIKTVNEQQGAAIAQNTADIAQNKKNIADNARNIAENAAEIAKHANTLKEHTADLAALHRDVQDNKTAIAKNASDIVGLRADLTEAEADIAQNTDGLNHVKTDIVRIDAKDTEQDNIIGNWKTDHPGQTISECATSQENELAEHAGQIAKLDTDKADKNEIPDKYTYTTDSFGWCYISGPDSDRSYKCYSALPPNLQDVTGVDSVTMSAANPWGLLSAEVSQCPAFTTDDNGPAIGSYNAATRKYTYTRVGENTMPKIEDFAVEEQNNFKCLVFRCRIPFDNGASSVALIKPVALTTFHFTHA